MLRRDEARELVLSSPLPHDIAATYDLREAGPPVLIRDALARLIDPEPRIVRVIDSPLRDAGLLIEVTMETAPMRAAMIDYGLRILILSAVISIITALLLFLAVRRLLVKPIKGVVKAMQSYAANPEDARRILQESTFPFLGQAMPVIDAAWAADRFSRTDASAAIICAGASPCIVAASHRIRSSTAPTASRSSVAVCSGEDAFASPTAKMTSPTQRSPESAAAQPARSPVTRTPPDASGSHVIPSTVVA